MTNTFDPVAWRSGADLIDQARESWETRTFAAQRAPAVSGNGSIPLDAELNRATEAKRLEWFDLIGNLGARLGSDHSKMRATAENYARTEDEAVEANARFWGEDE